MTNTANPIDHPFQNFICDECVYRKDGDMCSAYHLGMSMGYCPQIALCEKFKTKIKTK